jgi:hypothetical protein
VFASIKFAHQQCSETGMPAMSVSPSFKLIRLQAVRFFGKVGFSAITVTSVVA